MMVNAVITLHTNVCNYCSGMQEVSSQKESTVLYRLINEWDPLNEFVVAIRILNMGI